jgi:hypothetical protein
MTYAISSDITDQAAPRTAAFVAGRRGARVDNGIGCPRVVEHGRRNHSDIGWCWSLGRGRGPPNPPAQPQDLLARLVGPLWLEGAAHPPTPPWAARSTAARQLPYCFVSGRSSSNV